MELLFKRNQTEGNMGRVNFKLWSKIEFDEMEQEIVTRYKFNDAVLIVAIQPELMRTTILLSVGVFVLSYVVTAAFAGFGSGVFFGLVVGAGFGNWYFNEKRETIFIKDLIHGRDFSCASVVELARKEAWLGTIVAYLRQVMESAKHWDGTERLTVNPLPKDEARQVILKGL